ncbi:MAG: aldo/keto reductase [Pseudomonadota bacterium]
MDRRQFVSLTAAAGLTTAFPGLSLAAGNTILSRAIPSSGEHIPVLGMGTWITFNVGRSKRLRNRSLKVLETFFAGGGGMIDSSPMYGTSEEVIGYCLAKLPPQKRLFSATKVWTATEALGIQQMENSEALWNEKQFDLMQIHNLVDWQTHMKTLEEWKAAKRIRYSGITTSHGRRHGEFEQIMREQKFDFAQFTYNIADREAEDRLLPAAADRGMAVIINRPFQRGALIQSLKDKPLPHWAGDIGVQTWPQFLLKFVLSHPAVTCAIPATSNPAHMAENLTAGRGEMPDARMRQRMLTYVQDL